MFKKHRFSKASGKIKEIAGPGNVFCSEADLLLYSYDSGLDRAKPEAVVRITDRSLIAPVVKCLYENEIAYVARGSGTNLSGGCVPLKGGVVLNLSLLNKILEVDTAENFAVVEPGVCNMALQNRLAETGHFYAPDPASQRVCSIGGNVGENSGGPRCLKYGVTSNHVIRMEWVTPEGKTARWSVDDPGPDMLGLMVGSEGTLGIATKIWLKILKEPESIRTALCSFPSVEAAITAVTEIIKAGVVPRTIEAMDKITASAVEARVHAGYPANAEAVLLMEVDGSRQKTERDIKIVETICRNNSCLDWRPAATPEEREKLWEGRRGAYAAMSRLAPNVLVEDGVVPRPKLPEALKSVRDIASRYEIKVGLLFHAGDGNLHPNIIFDERNRDETRRVKKAGYEILKACVALGGSISGEHGIGVEKRVGMSWLYDSGTIELFRGVKSAFDPENLANPDKIIPVSQHTEIRQALLKPAPREWSQEAGEIVREVRERAQRSRPSVISGLRTRLKALNPDYKKEELLPLETMRSIVDLDKPNYTVTVEAGIDLPSFKKELAAEDCHLRIPDMEGTLGGILASKAWIPARDLVLGMQVLLPDGTIADLGGKVVKNVAGYDITKLMLGSWGAYGIILTVTLKLHSQAQPAGKKEAPRPASMFKPGEYHRKLKKAFDPGNLFNPWIFAGPETGVSKDL